MSKIITTSEFITNAKITHGNKYDYSKVEYTTAKTKVNIVCRKHGDFKQTPNNHLGGKGCPKCAGMLKTTEDIVREFKNIHSDNYEYSKVQYTKSKNNVTIICPEHGEFEQTPSSHLRGHGCPECAKIRLELTRTYNAYCVKFKDLVQPENYKLIPLTKGKFAMVDNEDFDRVKGINWYFDGVYPKNNVIGRMHRYIMNPPDDMVVDHINGDKLDNRKSNLRICTSQENTFNNTPQKESTSKYKGVAQYKNKWYSKIMCDGKIYNLGYFSNEIDCAKAYDKKALELFGEFAYLNFPELKEEASKA